MGKSKKRAAPQQKKQQKKAKLNPIVIAVAVMAVVAIALVLLLLPKGGTYRVEIDIANYGTIELELDGKTAPITVDNFVSLAESGFYDGLTFHRIIDGFMIQGGDPLGNGTGGSDRDIKGEFRANGVENDISHVRGVISMARNGYSMDSASSQFFIVQKDSTFLDGQYAAFGHVTNGIEIVDKICADTPVTDTNGTVESENQPVITAIRVFD